MPRLGNAHARSRRLALAHATLRCDHDHNTGQITRHMLRSVRSPEIARRSESGKKKEEFHTVQYRVSWPRASHMAIALCIACGRIGRGVK